MKKNNKMGSNSELIRTRTNFIRHIVNKVMPTGFEDFNEARKVIQDNFGAWKKPDEIDIIRAKTVWAERLRLVFLEQEKEITLEEALRFVDEDWKLRGW